MRKEQREFIISKLRSAVAERLRKVVEDRPTEYTMRDVLDYLDSKGVKVKDAYSALRAIEMEPNPTHEENKEFYKALYIRLNAEVSSMETALMLEKDPDANAMLTSALERIKGD